MRPKSSLPFRLAAAPLTALSLLAGLAAAPAHADRLRDRASADSFGNLVVWSRSGYKRIVVGQGHLAGRLNAYAAGAAPSEEADPELYAESGDAVRDEQRRRHASFHDCYRAPAFVKGRAYMYGLAEGEMPVLTPCEAPEGR